MSVARSSCLPISQWGRPQDASQEEGRAGGEARTGQVQVQLEGAKIAGRVPIDLNCVHAGLAQLQ